MAGHSTGFGTWHFSEEVMPEVEKFAAMFPHREYDLKDNFDMWGILFDQKDNPPLAQQQLQEIKGSDDESEDEPEQNIDHNSNPVTDIPPVVQSEQQLPPIIQANNEQGPLAMEELSVLHGSQFNESALLPLSQEPPGECQASDETDGIAEHIELLERGASEIDLTALPTAAVIEVFEALTDQGLCHAIEAVCGMKPADQARFNSIIVTHLLLPRLQEGDDRCTVQVMSAFSQFINSCPVLSSQQLLAPLIVATPPQYMSVITHLLREIQHQPQKDLILKAVLETLTVMNVSHLGFFLLLIGPSENNELKQQLVKTLSDSAQKFTYNLQFGKLLLRVIPIVSTQPGLKKQMANIVNHHDSVVQSDALKLLNN